MIVILYNYHVFYIAEIYSTLFLLYSMPLGTKKHFVIQAPSMHLTSFTIKKTTNTILTYSLTTGLYNKFH